MIEFAGLAVSIADVVIVGIIALAALLSFAWGFLRVVLVIGAWIGAAFVTLQLFPLATPYMRDLIPVQLIADAAAGVGIFVVSLIILSFVGDLVADQIRDTRMRPVDRSLGFLLGLVLGVAVVSVGYLGLTWAVGAAERPVWLANARLLPMIDYGATLLLKVVPPGMRPASGVEARNSGDTAPATAPRPAAGGLTAETEPGYKQLERRALESLLRSAEDKK